MYNRVILVGNLARDIELRYTPGGQAVAKCAVATNRKWKDAGGNPQEEVMFIDITLWGRTAEIANQYLHKGSRVLIEGRITLEQWTDQNGYKKSRHIVVVENLKMLDGKQSQTCGQAAAQHPQQPQPSQHAQHQAPKQQSQPKHAPNLPEIGIDEDEIPF